LTTAAEAKVAEQLTRVETIIAAERTQDQEEATWEERRVASAALQVDLDQAVTDATAHKTTMAEQLSTRSYLFQLAGNGIWNGHSNADYAAGCAYFEGEKLYNDNNANT